MNQDVIERSISIVAPIEQVYAAISTPEQFGQWFCEGIEGDFEVGSQPVMDAGEYGKFRLAIVAAEPPTYFAMRWVSGIDIPITEDPLKHPNTLIEYRLKSNDEGGTLVTVRESGFASLPSEFAQKNFDSNTGGWAFQMPRLQQFVETGKAE